jgi:hypothetical protein
LDKLFCRKTMRPCESRAVERQRTSNTIFPNRLAGHRLATLRDMAIRRSGVLVQQPFTKPGFLA